MLKTNYQGKLLKVIRQYGVRKSSTADELDFDFNLLVKDSFTFAFFEECKSKKYYKIKFLTKNRIVVDYIFYHEEFETSGDFKSIFEIVK